MGNGNVNQGMQAAMKRAADKGVVVVRSTRVTFGTVGRGVETDDDALGTVAAIALNPAKARVLLQLALLSTQDPARIQDLFNRY